MRALAIGIGNPLRRDDGVAHRVLELLLQHAPGLETRPVLQLTPELAEDISGSGIVVFIDGAAGAGAVSIEVLGESPPVCTLTHICTPAEIVVLSKVLFGFAGQAFQCRIPADDLSAGIGLSRQADTLAAEAARALETLLRSNGRFDPGVVGGALV